MSLQNFLNQLMTPAAANSSVEDTNQGFGEMFNRVTSQIPDGLAGGAAAGGIMALLMSSKSARKFAGTAASIGGAALLGGLAYKAYKNWQYNSANAAATELSGFKSDDSLQAGFQLALIKAMISAAKADGHINEIEQQRIVRAIEQMELSSETKGQVFDLLRRPIRIDEIVKGITNLEQKSEIYLASCLVLDPEHPSEQIHLEQLARAMQLPDELAQQLRIQAHHAARELVI